MSPLQILLEAATTSRAGLTKDFQAMPPPYSLNTNPTISKPARALCRMPTTSMQGHPMSLSFLVDDIEPPNWIKISPSPSASPASALSFHSSDDEDYTTARQSSPSSDFDEKDSSRQIFACNEGACGKVFYRKHHLASHMVTHTTARPFKCKLSPTCTSTFQR
ncbi:hypothetical protein BC830DRAFT_374178 [Chytriomyces sp. MP71]|nr:hypothetical protein BC830DRAFT_374178 [Chytriomyces sp. MP71]